jgi:hypothetical protein
MTIITKTSFDKKEVQQKLDNGMTIEEIVEQSNLVII